MSARETHPKREKATRAILSRVVIFTRARVLLALLSLRKNGRLLVVYANSFMLPLCFDIVLHCPSDAVAKLEYSRRVLNLVVCGHIEA